ncbi:MAG: HDIG domain-containing protein [Clostridia bacterium]
MKKKLQSHKLHLALSILIVGLTIIAISLLIFLKLSPLNSPVTPQNEAKSDIYAPFDFYDEQGTRMRAVAAYENQKPVVIRVNEAMFTAFEEVIDFFKTTDQARVEIRRQFPTQEAVRQNRENTLYLYISYASGKGVVFTEKDAILLLSSLGDTEYEHFKTNFKLLFADIQSSDIFEGNLIQIAGLFKYEISARLMNVAVQEISGHMAEVFLRINSIENESLTIRARQAAYEEIIRNSPVTVIKGSRIASRGEPLTGDQLRLLQDMGLLRAEGFDFYSFAMVLFIVLLMASLVFVFIRILQVGYRYDRKKLLVAGIILTLVFFLAYLIPGEQYLVVPVLIIPMLIAILLDEKTAAVLSVVSAIGFTLMFQADIAYTAMLIAGSLLSIYIIRKTSIRLKLALSGFVVGAFNILVLASIAFLLGREWVTSDLLLQSAVIMTGCVGASIITLGLLPVFEGFFNLITPFKLLEISNPTQPLIKRLLLEAPGTYHHSLMVGNLAEAGAEAIGADGLLARVGAYYHDVGKLNRPGFFTENQTINENPHDKMTPSLSTFVIVNHTKDGVELAKKYKLPHPIRDIIEEHHGTTKVKYFYEKARQAAGDKPVKDEEFRYPGPRPKTKESAAVLLADAVEASIRSLGSSTRGEIEGLVRRIIKEKIDDNQFSMCNLTFKDFDDIADAFTKVANGYFHQRIQYPDSKGAENIETKNQ